MSTRATRPTARSTPVALDRVRSPGDHALRSERDLVVYWMIGARRTTHSPALDRALALCRELDKPLLVVEPLRVGYRWASERIHSFVVDGMRDNAAAFARAGIAYHPYVEPRAGDGRGLLAALAQHAAVVVTDDALGFFQPRMLEAAARLLDVRLEIVDGNGLLPVRSVGAAQSSAQAFRRVMQRTVAHHLEGAPSPAPLASARATSCARGAEVPADVAARWPAAVLDAVDFATLPLDHAVRAAALRGGSAEAQHQLARFVERGLPRYAEERSQPDADAQSGLSPWLHFGHLSPHDVLAAVARTQPGASGRSASGGAWTAQVLAGARVTGRKEGFWRMDANAEAFLDELVTWRELSLNGAAYLDGFDSFDGTPAWARATLDAHASDERAHVYSLDELARSRTHDDVWNAAQRQLVQTGVLHNALRMLWGKNVLAWSPSPRAAFDVLVELNNRFAIDGRDANSYASIGWVFGRYDHPWPERAVFGSVRSMTTQSTRKKLDMDAYLTTFGVSGAAPGAAQPGLPFR